MSQFVNRIVGGVFPGYSHRQYNFDAFVSTLSDAFCQANPPKCAYMSLLLP
jgi:hypothetical protein